MENSNDNNTCILASENLKHSALIHCMCLPEANSLNTNKDACFLTELSSSSL